MKLNRSERGTSRPGRNSLRLMVALTLAVPGPLAAESQGLSSTPCLSPPTGLVSWWAAEGNASDTLGTNDGVVLGGVGFGTGQVGQGFVFNAAQASVRVPASSSLNVGAGSGFTVELWISPSHFEQRGPLVEWNNGQGLFGAHFYILGPAEFGLGPGNLYADIIDTSGWSHLIMAPGGTLRSNVFQHVALTYDKTSGVARIFRDGQVVAQQNMGSFTPRTSYDLILGRRPSGDLLISYRGLMDEVGLYNRALASTEIAAIYNAGSAGKCPPGVPPIITVQPQSQTVVEGGSATFSVEATGTPPLSYQWRLNGTDLPGARSSSLALANVQLSQAGSYSVRVSNAHGAVTSEAAVLTVTRPVCVTPPAGLVSWWAAEGNAGDSVGSNHGVASGGLGFGAGQVGRGFVFNTAEAAVHIPASSALDIGTESGLTIELWISPSNFGQRGPLVEWNDGRGTFGAHLYILGPQEFGLGPGNLYANMVDRNGWSHLIMAPGGTLRSNVFQHVAVTYDKGSGLTRLYRDGQVVAQRILASFTPQTSYDLVLGRRSSGDLLISYEGLMDEVGLYNRALTPAEIAAIYNAGSAGKCLPAAEAPVITVQPQSQMVVEGGSVTFTVAATGTPPLSYQWRLNGNGLAGATSSSLTLANVQLSQAGSYSVRVSNAHGAVTSEAAVLTVTRPVCVTPPVGLVSWWAAEGNAGDSVGSNHGVASGGLGFGAGQVGQGLIFNTEEASVRVPASSSLNVGAGGGFTVELWISPSNFGQRGPLVEWNNGQGLLGAHFYILGPAEFGLGPGNLYADILDTDGWSHLIMAPGGTLRSNVLQHVALTYDKTSGLARLFRDGQVVAERNLGTFTPQTSYDLILGRRPSGDLLISYRGLMDEVGLYNRALTAAEIAAIYNAGSSGKCAPRPNTPPVAVLQVSPVLDLSPFLPNRLVLSANLLDAAVRLDGSGSFDPDGDPLQYVWMLDGAGTPFATGPQVEHRLSVGPHVITLVVYDGRAAGSDRVDLEVITVSQAVAVLIMLLEDSALPHRHQWPIISSLRSVIAAFERGNLKAGRNGLESFQNRVRSQVTPRDAALGQRLMQVSQAILDALPGS